ncbi:MAG: RDD family protein [Propionibacteriaceae bacterium]|nr:RDD family protein [Propionibacteriaceae bacterium]
MDMDEAYPGESIGLPEQGRGALASWGARIAALLIDWLASMLVAVALFGNEVMVGSGWRIFMPLGVFFVESSVLTTLTGSSFGQLLARIGVARADGEPLGIWRPTVRSLLKCLVLPVMVIGAERRHLDDLLLGTVVVSRK